MALIDTALALQHVRADDVDTPLVEAMLEAAIDQAEQFIQRKVYEDEATLAAAVLNGTAGDDPILINPSIKAACLLILGHLYMNREDVVVGVTAVELPMGSRSLLMPYRVKMGV